MKFNPSQNNVFVDNECRYIPNMVVLMRGMIDGDSIPEVRLDHNPNDNSYLISSFDGIFGDDKSDGGHSRLFAAFLLGCELEVKVVKSSRRKQLEIPLRATVLSYDLSFLITSRFNGKKYSSLPSPESFFESYSRINEALRNAHQGDYSFSVESYSKLFEDYNAQFQLVIEQIQSFFI